jgi:hypothetical protein
MYVCMYLADLVFGTQTILSASRVPVQVRDSASSGVNSNMVHGPATERMGADPLLQWDERSRRAGKPVCLDLGSLHHHQSSRANPEQWVSCGHNCGQLGAEDAHDGPGDTLLVEAQHFRRVAPLAAGMSPQGVTSEITTTRDRPWKGPRTVTRAYSSWKRTERATGTTEITETGTPSSHYLSAYCGAKAHRCVCGMAGRKEAR